MCPTLLGQAHERNGIFVEFGIEFDKKFDNGFDKKIKKSHPVNHHFPSKNLCLIYCKCYPASGRRLSFLRNPFHHYRHSLYLMFLALYHQNYHHSPHSYILNLIYIL